MDYNLEDLEWKCQDCDASASPTTSNYMRLLKHQRGHHIRLLNTKTGEILASSIKEALSKGIEIHSDGKPAGKPAKEKTSGPGARDLIDITSRKPAPIIFTIGEHDIGLDPEPLYESYLLYEDLKTRLGFTDSFSIALKDAMVICYRLLGPEP